MSRTLGLISRFLVAEDGVAAVEYSVMMALIILALVAVIGTVTQAISGTFSTVSSTLGS